MSLRFTDPQLKSLVTRARSHNLKPTVYAQDLINNGGVLAAPVDLTQDTPAIYSAYLLFHQEFRKQGNKLNQIAKAINTTNLEGRQIDAEAYLDMLSDIREAIDGIVESIAKLEAGS